MKRKRILLVDDDLRLVRHLEKRCRNLGLEVYSAVDALQAVTLLNEKKPDLLCLSGTIPGGNGMRLCEMVLASPDDVSCPVIVMTESQATPPSSAEMCVYYVQKRPKVWKYLEPVIFELIDIQPAGRRSSTDGRGGRETRGAGSGT